MPNDESVDLSPESGEKEPSAKPEPGGWSVTFKEVLLRYRRYFEQVGLVLLGGVLALGTGLYVESRMDRNYDESFHERLVIELPVVRGNYDTVLETMQRQLQAAIWVLEASGQPMPPQANRVHSQAEADTSIDLGRAMRRIAYPTNVSSLRLPAANDLVASGGFARLDDRDLRTTIGLLLMLQDGSELISRDILASKERVIESLFDDRLGELLVADHSGSTVTPAELSANVLGAVSLHATLIAAYLTSIEAEAGIIDSLNEHVQ